MGSMQHVSDTPLPQIIFTTESALFNMWFVLSCLVRLFHCSVLSENLKSLFQTERVICVHCLQVTHSKCSNSCNTQQFFSQCMSYLSPLWNKRFNNKCRKSIKKLLRGHSKTMSLTKQQSSITSPHANLCIFFFKLFFFISFTKK